jgi:hypothetical protein
MRVNTELFNILPEVKDPTLLKIGKGTIDSINILTGTAQLTDTINVPLLTDIEFYFHCQGFAEMVGVDRLALMQSTAHFAFNINDEVLVVTLETKDSLSDPEVDPEWQYIFSLYGAESPPLCKKDLLFINISAFEPDWDIHVYPSLQTYNLTDCYDLLTLSRYVPVMQDGTFPFTFPVDPTTTEYLDWYAEQVKETGVERSDFFNRGTFRLGTPGFVYSGDPDLVTGPYPVDNYDDTPEYEDYSGLSGEYRTTCRTISSCDADRYCTTMFGSLASYFLYPDIITSDIGFSDAKDPLSDSFNQYSPIQDVVQFTKDPDNIGVSIPYGPANTLGSLVKDIQVEGTALELLKNKLLAYLTISGPREQCLSISDKAAYIPIDSFDLVFQTQNWVPLRRCTGKGVTTKTEGYYLNQSTSAADKGILYYTQSEQLGNFRVDTEITPRVETRVDVSNFIGQMVDLPFTLERSFKWVKPDYETQYYTSGVTATPMCTKHIWSAMDSVNPWLEFSMDTIHPFSVSGCELDDIVGLSTTDYFSSTDDLQCYIPMVLSIFLPGNALCSMIETCVPFFGTTTIDVADNGTITGINYDFSNYTIHAHCFTLNYGALKAIGITEPNQLTPALIKQYGQDNSIWLKDILATMMADFEVNYIANLDMNIPSFVRLFPANRLRPTLTCTTASITPCPHIPTLNP